MDVCARDGIANAEEFITETVASMDLWIPLSWPVNFNDITRRKGRAGVLPQDACLPRRLPDGQ